MNRRSAHPTGRRRCRSCGLSRQLSTRVVAILQDGCRAEGPTNPAFPEAGSTPRPGRDPPSPPADRCLPMPSGGPKADDSGLLRPLAPERHARCYQVRMTPGSPASLEVNWLFHWEAEICQLGTEVSTYEVPARPPPPAEMPLAPPPSEPPLTPPPPLPPLPRQHNASRTRSARSTGGSPWRSRRSSHPSATSSQRSSSASPTSAISATWTPPSPCRPFCSAATAERSCKSGRPSPTEGIPL